TEIVGSMLAFAAGVFICIALSDLLPEMEFHSHHRVPLSLALLAGIALAWMIRYLEPVNVHSPNPGTTIQLGEDFQLPPIESE
ncbi:ZIP family metal transporter, partial [Planctomicrobium sp.]|nr:ZIP family metal transporter [Planctomicrobium sp.]